ncbi:nucleosome assembly protein 1;4-like isoform X3 [Oryza brachyantha]|nr:nucleosome assembly protein 1;4-like isoform X3 [Oryza brachyantha]
MAKANDKLQLDVKNKRPEEYDIEALTGNEKEYIEMDLLLGVADLHSEKGVEVAEATMNGFPPTGRSFTCSSSDSEDDSDDSDEDDGDEQNMSAKDEDESETQTSKRKEAQ